MRDYELMLIVRGDWDEEKNGAVLEKVTGLITGQGGTIENLDKWGKRRLAYLIQEQADGHYTVVNFKGVPAVEQELDRVLKITDGVIRFLIVRPNE